MKQTIRLTESQLRQTIKETIKKVLKEEYEIDYYGPIERAYHNFSSASFELETALFTFVKEKEHEMPDEQRKTYEYALRALNEANRRVAKIQNYFRE